MLNKYRDNGDGTVTFWATSLGGLQAVVVDAEDWHGDIGKYRWTIGRVSKRRAYAMRYPVVNGKQTSVYLHRVLIDAPRGVQVDHRNGDTFDNRRSNLRIATPAQNGANRGAPTNNTSGYKGVSWCKKNQGWRASIRRDGKYRHLGYFATPELACQAYQQASLEHDGTFAFVQIGV